MRDNLWVTWSSITWCRGPLTRSWAPKGAIIYACPCCWQSSSSMMIMYLVFWVALPLSRTSLTLFASFMFIAIMGSRFYLLVYSNCHIITHHYYYEGISKYPLFASSLLVVRWHKMLLQVQAVNIQFKMSSKADRIREKFRQQIRARQIGQMLKVQRERALRESQSKNYFVVMDQKIKNNAQCPTDMDIVKELVEMLDQYAKQENTYILIGNYVINHPDACKYFEFRMLGLSGLAKKLQHYRWALLILLTRLENNTLPMLKEYDLAIADIVQACSTPQLASCFSILYLLLSVETLRREVHFYPPASIRQFFDKLLGVEFEQLQPDTQYSVMSIVHLIGEYHMDDQSIREYIPEMMKLLVIGIQQYCSFRGDFIAMIRRIAIDYYEDFEEVFSTKLKEPLLLGLFYMYTNLPQQRTHMLTIFHVMIIQFPFQLVMDLLANGMHVALVSTFEHNDPSHLAQALEIILRLFQRIEEKSEEKNLELVKNQLQEHKFEAYLEGLFRERQDPHLEKVMNELVDSYYSDEVA